MIHCPTLRYMPNLTSAASATFAKIWYMRDISKVTDITYAWAPISVCYM